MPKFPKWIENALVMLLKHKGGRGDALHFTRKAWDKLNEGRINDAARLGRYAVASDPTYADGWRALALAHRAMKDTAGARDILNDALINIPSDPNLLVVLGDLERECDRFAESEPFYRKALEQKPGDSETLWALAQSLRGQQRFNEAEEILKVALEASNGSAKILRTIGSNLIDLRRYDEALSILKEAYSLDTRDPITNYSIAYVMGVMGDYDDALGFIEQALKSDASNDTYIRLKDDIVARARAHR